MNYGIVERFMDVEIATKRLPSCYGYLTAPLVPLKEAIEPIHNLIPGLENYAKKARKHATFPNKHNLTRDEAASIYLYTMEMGMGVETSFYFLLNQTLRNEDRNKVKPFFYYLKLLDSAVSKLPPTKCTLWRGINKNISFSFKKNEMVTWWSISSCSTSVEVIQEFLGKTPECTLFNIEGLQGKSISEYTNFPNEDEIILMPGTTLKVVSDPLTHHGGLNIVHLKEIDDESDDDEDGHSQQGAGKPPQPEKQVQHNTVVHNKK
ncbi:unnamed protein product [Didymodactylos carnosus]|uniref:NAD(P)(+)--arginine ADP-ribosyltransferase n=1 Tax=Didymodactylos carnosus TaxID=1234261 RepID=A0A814B2R7_9BILA|nr:unnamed protein product [Didymodactylos carnosus]CAF0977445.1 unnamed protein product [Didymodactylos carnosus]CAF3700439.1 unnamed protein product [Didymodactylos carnosus]CAF3748151.1 unnamed protein product [Didymodactylos carnosus]